VIMILNPLYKLLDVLYEVIFYVIFYVGKVLGCCVLWIEW